MPDRVLILGASARAAAASARRAGLEPFCIDLFADRDTRLLGDCLRCQPDDYPDGLFQLAKQAPPMPWMYTGGLENYPELIGELAHDRELWGNGPDVLRRVRDPRWLAAQVFDDFPYPRVVMPGDRPPESGEWVRKPLRGSGGRGVQIAGPEDLHGISDPGCDYFLQEFIHDRGRRLSIVYRRWRPLGLSHQLVGEPWLHAPPFAYCGSVRWIQSLKELVDLLWTVRDICGVWGADIAIPPGWCCRVLYEINPRYPASAEVIEFATNLSVLTGEHRGPGVPNFNPVTPIVGKAIYYAPRRLLVPASGPWDESLRHAADVWRRPDFADIPHPGDMIELGQPVVTVLAAADTESECVARLKSRAAELDQLFGIPAPQE